MTRGAFYLWGVALSLAVFTATVALGDWLVSRV